MSRLARSAFPRAFFSSESWVCRTCSKTGAPSQTAHAARHASNSTRPGRTGPTMEQLRAQYGKKNQTAVNYALSLAIGTVALSYGSVPLYKMICQTTGWGGQPIKSPSHYAGADDDQAERLIPEENYPRFRVTFASSVSSILPWKFVPQQREVRVRPGESALAFYTATNMSDEDIIGIATYSVTPGQVAPYFAKIQCFCFEEQRLRAGESVDMPVFFFIDKGIMEDMNCRRVGELTLNYTFFKAKYDKDGHLTPVPM